RPIGRWGRLHEEYLKKNKRYVFEPILISGKLCSYLADIDG
ncbi:MAG: TnpV protein, partial [Ruminococcus sp.]|nr:TnpV protein [Ruminococcus sp.]